MGAEWVLSVLGIVFGAGMGSVLTVVMQGKATARKLDAEASAINVKTPAEADSIALQGAESAVRVLQQTNSTLVSENTRLFTENGRLRSQLEQYEARLEQMRQRAEVAERALATATEQLRLVQKEYEAMSADIQTFRNSQG